LGHVSNRGTYSDAETCVCQRHYGDSYSAHYHRGHYSDMDTSSRLRHCPYSEGESDFEPHYLEQTASGNVYIPGKDIGNQKYMFHNIKMSENTIYT